MKRVRLTDCNEGQLQKIKTKRCEILGICRKELLAHGVDASCTETVDALDEAVHHCVYLDRDLVTSKLLKQMDKHEVSLTQLNAIYLTPKTMSVNMKREIISNEQFKWMNTVADIETAKEYNINAKSDEELFCRRCMGKRVIIYEIKDEQH